MPVLPKKQAPATGIVVALHLLQKTKMKQYD